MKSAPASLLITKFRDSRIGSPNIGAPIMNRIFKLGLWNRLIEDLRLLFALIKDYWKGTYRDVSIWSVVVFALATAYVISPIDILPDYLPLLGQLDDAGILIFGLYLLEKDLHKYKDWKYGQLP